MTHRPPRLRPEQARTGREAAPVGQLAVERGEELRGLAGCRTPRPRRSPPRRRPRRGTARASTSRARRGTAAESGHRRSTAGACAACPPAGVRMKAGRPATRNDSPGKDQLLDRRTGSGPRVGLQVERVASATNPGGTRVASSTNIKPTEFGTHGHLPDPRPWLANWARFNRHRRAGPLASTDLTAWSCVEPSCARRVGCGSRTCRWHVWNQSLHAAGDVRRRIVGL